MNIKAFHIKYKEMRTVLNAAQIFKDIWKDKTIFIVTDSTNVHSSLTKYSTNS